MGDLRLGHRGRRPGITTSDPEDARAAQRPTLWAHLTGWCMRSVDWRVDPAYRGGLGSDRPPGGPRDLRAALAPDVAPNAYQLSGCVEAPVLYPSHADG
jgi:hypothetical protein